MTGDRLKEILQKLKVSQSEIARQLGMSHQSFNQMLSAADIKSGLLERISQVLDIPISSLYGEQPDMQVRQIHHPRYTEQRTDEPIPLYNLEAAAGLNSLFNSEEHQQILGMINIPNIPKCDGAVYVKGDSMYPLLKAGDIVAYKQVSNSLDSIIFGEMYLVDIDLDGEDYLAVKYINKSEKGDDYIKLVSYNPHHADKDIHIKHIRAMALVKVSVRFNTMR